jgi:hypothetical protein
MRQALFGLKFSRHFVRKGYLAPLALIVLNMGIFASAIATSAADLDTGAGQIVGLFMQACVPQYGDILAVRNYLEDHKVPHMPDEGAVHFLKGRSGIVYDASNRTGRYGVTTLDNGVCDAFAETAKPSDAVGFLEASLKSKGLTVIRLKDYVDPRETRLHHYDYLIVRDGVTYDLVASVGDATHTIQAQLGFWRRGPSERLPDPLPPPL